MDILSNDRKLMVVSALAATLAVAPLLAQAGERPGKEEGQPTQEIRAAETRQISIVKHDVLIGAGVTNGRDEERLAKVSDLVLDGQSGQVLHAVLAVGRKHTLVAWNALKWDEKKASFTLAMTAEALKEMPEFDPQAVQRLARASAAAGKGSDGMDGEAKRGALDASNWRETHLLASKIGDCAVLASKEKVGSPSGVFIEPTTGSAAFLSVASGGVLGIGETNYLLPWGSLRFVKPIGEPAMEIQLDKTAKDLETAPKLGDTGADVNKSEFRDKVYKFYGVERPAFESMKSKDGN